MNVQPILSVGIAYDPGRVHAADGRNEDAYGLSPQLDVERLAFYGALYVVADGMGGHADGDLASRLAVEQLQQVYYADPDPDRAAALQRAIEAANQAIYERSGGGGDDRMGSTVVAVVVRGGEVITGNVGDSRAYLVRAGIARQISQDHTWVAEQVRAGQLSAEEAAHHNMRNVLARSLGDGPNIEPFVSAGIPLLAGDRLLLCSDGVWELVGDADLASLVSVSSPQQAAMAVAAAANQRGGHDNITALIVSLEPSPAGLLGQAAPPDPRIVPYAAAGLGALAVVLLALICWASGLLPAASRPVAATFPPPLVGSATANVVPTSQPDPVSTVTLAVASPTGIVQPPPPESPPAGDLPISPVCANGCPMGESVIQHQGKYIYSQPNSLTGFCKLRLGAPIGLLEPPYGDAPAWHKVRVLVLDLESCTGELAASCLEFDGSTCVGFISVFGTIGN